MPLELDCPGCQKHYSVPDAMAGKKVKCKCGTSFEAVAALAETDMLEELTDDGGLSSMDDLLGDVGVGGGSSDPFGDTDVLGMSSSAADPLALGGTSAQAKAPGAKASQTAANEAAANKMALMTSCVIGGVALLTALICLFLSGASLAMLMLFMGLAVAGFSVVACMVGLEKAAWPLVGAHGLMAVVGLGFGIYHYSQREQSVVAEAPTTPTTDPNATNPDTTNPTTPPTDPNPTTPPKPEGEKPPTTPDSNLSKINVAEDWNVKFTQAVEADPTPPGQNISGPVTTINKLNEKLAEFKMNKAALLQIRPFSPWLLIGSEEDKAVVWNLSTGNTALELSTKNMQGINIAFDGRHSYRRVGEQGEIYSLENGQKVVDVPESIASKCYRCEFAANDRVMFLVTDDKAPGKAKLLIHEIRDLKPLHTIPCHHLDPSCLRVSGNGRYAMINSARERGAQAVEGVELKLLSIGYELFDTRDGKRVAELYPKVANEVQFPDGLQPELDAIKELLKAFSFKAQVGDAVFSHDGRELAILEHTPGVAPRILIVELATGNLTEVLSLDANAIGAKELRIFDQRLIEWAPDGTGLLLMGRTLIARAGGKIVAQMQNLPKEKLFYFLSTTEILHADMTNMPLTVTVEGTP